MSDDENRLFGSLGKDVKSSYPAGINELRDQMVGERIRELGYETNEHTYIHQLPNWPTFS